MQRSRGHKPGGHAGKKWHIIGVPSMRNNLSPSFLAFTPFPVSPPVPATIHRPAVGAEDWEAPLLLQCLQWGGQLFPRLAPTTVPQHPHPLNGMATPLRPHIPARERAAGASSGTQPRHLRTRLHPLKLREILTQQISPGAQSQINPVPYKPPDSSVCF